MHDPLVVVCEIRRPLPKVRIMKQRYKRSGAYYDALSPAKKLLHNFRSPHWRFGRVELYWPSIAPSGTVSPATGTRGLSAAIRSEAGRCCRGCGGTVGT